MPLDNLKLTVEPRYPFPNLQDMSFGSGNAGWSRSHYESIGDAFDFSNRTIHPINSWYSKSRRAVVIVYHTGDGRSKVGIVPGRDDSSRLQIALNTLMPIPTAWSLEAESTAMLKLKEHVTAHAFRCYAITGSFLESSPRSNVCYMFRRCRPTIAFRQDERTGEFRILTTLCLHPIGYYQNSFAGVMVPTDDVLAHLLMMRGDEAKFWSKANHHPTHLAEAGL